jgi:hypothetical protein
MFSSDDPDNLQLNYGLEWSSTPSGCELPTEAPTVPVALSINKERNYLSFS